MGLMQRPICSDAFSPNLQVAGLSSESRSAYEARALVVERPAGHQVLHCPRVIARAQGILLVQAVRRFDLRDVDLHPQTGPISNQPYAVDVGDECEQGDDRLPPALQSEFVRLFNGIDHIATRIRHGYDLRPGCLRSQQIRTAIRCVERMAGAAQHLSSAGDDRPRRFGFHRMPEGIVDRDEKPGIPPRPTTERASAVVRA
jgi:hypothetical protein